MYAHVKYKVTAINVGHFMKNLLMTSECRHNGEQNICSFYKEFYSLILHHAKSKLCIITPTGQFSTCMYQNILYNLAVCKLLITDVQQISTAFSLVPILYKPELRKPRQSAVPRLLKPELKLVSNQHEIHDS